MQLSKNLTLHEVLRSATAEKYGIDNNDLTPEKQEKLKQIANHIFQPARDKLGPIRVTSGYRSSPLNKKIGGASSSQHSKGEALDLQVIKGDNTSLFNYIKDHLDFDQLIWEFGDANNPQWVHVSYTCKENNRHMILQSYREDGKVKYKRI